MRLAEDAREDAGEDDVLLHRLVRASPWLALLMAALALTKPWAEPAAEGLTLGLLMGADGFAAASFLAVRMLIVERRLPTRAANVATAALLGVLVADASLHAALLHKPPEAEIVTFILVMVGGGAFLTQVPWFAATVTGACGVWAMLAFANGGSGAPLAAVHLGTGALVACVLFAVQTATLRRTESLRRLSQERARRAEALAEETRASNRELEAFAYTASHDLRAPLRAIQVHAEAALESEDLPPSTRDHLERVFREGERLAGLVEDLLALARVGQEALRIRPVDVSALADAVAEDLHHAEPERRVDVAIAPGLSAYADPGLLRTVLENLLGNAWKFTARRDYAHIEVGADETARGRAFYVRDDGIGFPASEAQSLFQPFRRLASAAGSEGSGIGLTSVERIVRRHGGEVWAEARPGEGATFWFTLPGR